MKKLVKSYVVEIYEVVEDSREVLAKIIKQKIKADEKAFKLEKRNETNRATGNKKEID